MLIHKIKASIPIWFILAATFLALLFLLRMIIKANIDDTLSNQIVVKDYQYTRWGQIPGDLNYEQTKTVQFYASADPQPAPGSQPNQLNFKKQDPLEFKITRDYSNVDYIPQQGTVAVNELYKTQYQGDPSTMQKTSYSQLNVGGLSLWYQLKTKQDFYQIFQALSKIRQTYVDSLAFKLYAFHGYHYYFYDENMVINNYLKSFDADVAKKIYNDPVLGMNTVTKLYYWFQACSSSTNVEALRAYYAIIANFQARGIDLSGVMDKLVGPRSPLKMIYTQILTTAKLSFKMYNDIDNDALFQIQWSSMGVVSNDDIKLSPSTPHVNSFKDLDPSNIESSAEFAYYCQSILKKDVTPLSQTQTISLFSLDPTYGNLMNPANIKTFLEKYDQGEYDTIQKIFQVTDNTQIDALYQYFNWIVGKFLTLSYIGGDYESNTFARLMLKTMTYSYFILQQQVPFELASRYLTGYIEKNAFTCLSFAAIAAPTDVARQNALCKNINFERLEDVKFFLKPTFFLNPDDITAFKAKTTMTDDEYNLFYGPDIKSFQTAYTTQLTKISSDFKCKLSTTNCTGDEIAQIQMGSSGITLFVPEDYKNNQYFKNPSKSISSSWQMTAKPVEYYYYISEVMKVEEPLLPGSVAIIVSNVTGITSEDAATTFVVNVTNNRNISDYQENLKITNVKNFLLCLRYMVQEYLTGGLVTQKTIAQWTSSFTEDFYNIIMDGNFFQGTDKDLESTITPIFNENNRDVANAELRVDTGALKQNRIARIRQLNEKPYLNIKKQLFNGTGPVDVQINPWKSQISLDDATNGMQFKPEINEGSLNVFDNRMQRNMICDYSEDSTFGSGDNQVQGKKYVQNVFGNKKQKYSESPDNTIDLGPAFNLPLVASLQGGKDISADNLSKVTLDGNSFQSAASGSQDYYYLIEPFSGFLLQKETSMTVYLNLDADMTYPFPDLDKIGKQLIPLYDVKETLKIDASKFNSDFGFVQTGNQSRHGILISFIVLCSVFFLLGLLSTVVFCCKKEQIKQGSVLQTNQDRLVSEMTNGQDSEKKYNKLLS